MRDITKSLLSATWALSLFGARQFATVTTGLNNQAPLDEVGAGFDAVTRVAVQQMGETFSQFFDSGDKMQRATVDMFLDFFSRSSSCGRPAPTAAGQQPVASPGADTRIQGPSQGGSWGPMPPVS
jgi:hypothetical protein